MITVCGHGPIRSATLTAVSFTAQMLTLGGSELQEFWLAHDAAQFRTIGTGVSALIGQKAAINATEGTGANQPSMQAGAASNGRDAIRFNRTAQTRLMTAASFAGVTGDRWGICSIGKLLTSPPVALGRMHEFGLDSVGDSMDLYFTTTPNLNWIVHYDNGGSGASNSVTASYNSTSPLAVGVFASNPHNRYLNGTTTSMTQTAGLSTRVNGNNRLSFGRAFDSAAGYVDCDLWCTMLFKMSGTAMPSGFASMMALARTYYAEAGL